MRTAAYARFSSDLQRDASLDDQLRNCRAYCERMGWLAPVEYTDAAMSGARNDRPGYLRLMAESSRYDVILVDDLTRLSRDSIEATQSTRRLTFAGVRVIGVSDGLDTGRKGHKADVGLRGLMGELYLDDLRDKTHRGLTGRALAGASAGGLPYGYRVTSVGQRAIDEAQAAVVRRIFAEYLAGASPRTIVSGLNRDRIAPARGATWCMTAVHGDVRRGIGILANPIYFGRQVWNRSRWVKHPETGRRVRQERPAAEWITTEQPELAIIDQSTWEAVQARLRGASPKRADTGRQGGPGRPPRHLLSGILRCADCGGPLVIVDRYRYGCSTHKDRGDTACPSRIRVPREAAEHALLAGVRAELLSEAAFARYQRGVTAVLKTAAPDLAGAARRVAEAEQVQANIMAALRAGIITASTKAELITAEKGVALAQAELAALRSYQPSQIVPRMRERWRGIVAGLTDRRDVPAVRQALRELVGENIIVRNKNGALVAEIAPSSQINLVAGAGSVLYLTEPLTIPLLPAPANDTWGRAGVQQHARRRLAPGRARSPTFALHCAPVPPAR